MPTPLNNRSLTNRSQRAQMFELNFRYEGFYQRVLNEFTAIYALQKSSVYHLPNVGARTAGLHVILTTTP